MRSRVSKTAALIIIACTNIAAAQTTSQLNHNLAVTASPSEASTGQAAETQLLQLEVYINDRATNLIGAFMLHPDGRITSSAAELQAIGLKIPPTLAGRLDIPLEALPDVRSRYDETAQSIHFTAAAGALLPTIINGQTAEPSQTPTRPPLGGTMNYTLFASAAGDTAGFHFQGVSGEFQTRAFGSFGLLENSFIERVGDDSALIRLDSSYTFQDPARLWTAQAGDFVSRGFSWTRPIRMAGLQIHRDFGLRPDLITMPLPTLTGSAAASSTLDLYVNQVRALSTTIPQGPYAIENPPMLNGSGQAQVVVRDALGRETVSSTPFYASSELLAPGLTDYSAEVGFARRNYGTASNDYDGALALSGSYRRGISPGLTLDGHAESADGLILLGGGGTGKLGNFGLLSFAASGSRTPNGSGGLVDIEFESRSPAFSLILRSQRTFGDYEDLASWTAELPGVSGQDRRIFDQPQALDQAAISFPLPWPKSSIGASFVHLSRYDGERSQIAGLSFNQDLGRLSLFANVMRDLDDAHSTHVYVGLSISLGHGVTATAGTAAGRNANASFVEASRQGTDEPGTVGWAVRASEGDEREFYGIGRYNASFARFEGTGSYRDGTSSATAMMEGALSTVAGEGLFASRPLNDAFAVVDVGVPNVAVLRENRAAGVTNRAGRLLVPDLTPFVANRLAIDPSGLPVDAQVNQTAATVTPYSRVASVVDLRVNSDTQSAIVVLNDPQGHPIELGSIVRVEGSQEEFVVGYDGQTYLDSLKPHNVLTVTTPDNAACRADFAYHSRKGQQVRIGPVSCMPEQ